jgi:hypothetical protein
LREQQFACSRQIAPSGVQLRASTSLLPIVAPALTIAPPSNAFSAERRDLF